MATTAAPTQTIRDLIASIANNPASELHHLLGDLRTLAADMEANPASCDRCHLDRDAAGRCYCDHIREGVDK